MFLFRPHVVAAPAVAPVAPRPRIHDILEEHIKGSTKWSTIGFVGFLGGLFFLLYLYKFWTKSDVENFDQIHQFMPASLLVLFGVVLYQLIFVSYERAQFVIQMATPLFVSFFCLKKFVRETFLRRSLFTF